MKKLSSQALNPPPASSPRPAIAGKPPKGLMVRKQALDVTELDTALHQQLIRQRASNISSSDDFQRIQAELEHELGKV